MHRFALLLAFIPAVALAQGDAPRPASVTPPPSTAAAAPVKPAPPRPQLASLPPAPADPADCRMACAQASYVCRASDNPDACDGNWGQCVANCDLPSLGPGYSTVP